MREKYVSLQANRRNGYFPTSDLSSICQWADFVAARVDVRRCGTFTGLQSVNHRKCRASAHGLFQSCNRSRVRGTSRIYASPMAIT